MTKEAKAIGDQPAIFFQEDMGGGGVGKILHPGFTKLEQIAKDIQLQLLADASALTRFQSADGFAAAAVRRAVALLEALAKER